MVRKEEKLYFGYYYIGYYGAELGWQYVLLSPIIRSLIE
jgi:hypothetical protein